jgi:short-subunit dehydrogenase
MKTAALITGASSGIGCELSKLFVRNGHNVVLVARNQGKLQQLADE